MRAATLRDVWPGHGDLPRSALDALTPAHPLRRFRLLEVETGHGLTSAPLRIDERILDHPGGREHFGSAT